MSIELECKLAVANHESVREKLRAAGAVRLGCVLETNRLFDDDQKRLLASDCGLRVRDVTVLDGDSSLRRATFTFKGPVARGAFKRREEIELSIGSADAMALMLEALGYTSWITFQKRRESWVLPGTSAVDSQPAECRIDLDELPRLGFFVEVEGPNEPAIRSAVQSIGLDPARSILRGYPAMIAEHAGETRPIHLAFS